MSGDPKKGSRYLKSLIEKLEVWIAAVAGATPDAANEWTWDRLTSKGESTLERNRWMALPVLPSRLVVVVPAFDKRAWRKLTRWVKEHRRHFESAQIWRLHAPLDFTEATRSTVYVHDLLGDVPESDGSDPAQA